ncbi:hypothetical protein C8R47DRAFT_1225269 [Mycena vitilis]|nr:hypothetical protein C8R47DRAFT_1225269 [Mycena vitilis]
MALRRNGEASAAMAVDRDTIYRPGLLPPTAIQHLLRSNEPPGEAEIVIITGLISRFQHTVDALTARIGIPEATGERHVLAERVQRYTAVLSPIRRMPPEIMCEIFSWTLPHTRRGTGGIVTTVAPWYLGQISTRWREIALALPSLWSSITILHRTYYSPVKPSLLPMVEAQLIRSADEPLDVHFEWRRAEDDARPYLAALLHHSNRWVSFRLICCDQLHALLQLLCPAKGRLSRLKTLDILDPDYDDPDATVLSTALDTFSIAPALREVFFDKPTYYLPSPPLLIPWHQITRYRGVASIKCSLRILRTASHLVEGAFGVSDKYSETLDDTVMVSPHLQRLDCEQGDLLDHVIAPHLAYLSCDMVNPILPFLQRSSCLLTTLVLTLAYGQRRLGVALAPADVISVLEHTSTLEGLVLEANPKDQQGNDRVLSVLTVTDTSVICPTLTFFAYGSATDADAFSRAIFIRAIHSRLYSAHTRRLSHIRVLCPAKQAKAADSQDEMRTLVDEGLDVEVVNAFDFIWDPSSARPTPKGLEFRSYRPESKYVALI